MATNSTPIRALDAQDAAGAAAGAHTLKAAGYGAVGAYYFRNSSYKTLLTRQAADRITAAGLSVFSVYENGMPTAAAYFSTASGNTDAHTAAVRALDAGQPAATPIFHAVDYDADPADLPAIVDYFTEVRRVLESVDPAYTAGVYGSGLVCRHLSELGLVSHTWLSQSRGFSGFADWEPRANIVQGVETTVLGLDVDLDTAIGDYGGWVPV